MKATYRIAHPTDQYAFIEVEEEFEPTNPTKEPERFRRNYDAIKAVFKDNQGLTEKEMDTFLDEQLSGNGIKNGAETYEKMSPEQQKRVQWVKRAIKRKSAKDEKKVM